MTLVAVLVAGAVGAVVRHLLTIGLESRPQRSFPAGLLTANVAGSFVLGALVGARVGGDLTATTLTVLGTGFCGALTSWSTFSVDVAARIEAGRSRSAAGVVALSLVLGGVAAAAGLALAGGL